MSHTKEQEPETLEDDEPPGLVPDSINCELKDKAATNKNEGCINHETGMSGSDEDDFDEMDDCSEEVWWKADGTKKCKDLFSTKMFFNAQQCLDYCRNIHGFNLKILKKRHNMDCFSFFRLVNYLRSQKPSPGLVMSLSSDALWQDEKYLKPIEEDDPLLMIDIEEDVYDSIEDEEEEDLYSSSSKSKSAQSRSEKISSGNPSSMAESSNSSSLGYEVTTSLATGSVDISVAEYENLKEEILMLRSKMQERNKDFENLLSDMDHMKAVTKNLLLDHNELGKTDSNDQESVVKSVSESRTENDDSGYAGSYAHFGIHHEMLSDHVRTQSYKEAVSNNSKSLKDKLILDLGCGTGILSMFCAKLGYAKHVVGVDMSDIAHQAMDIVRENELNDNITIIKGRLEDVNLNDKLKDSNALLNKTAEPVKFDVLISELGLNNIIYEYLLNVHNQWMGYFLLFEGMLDSVISAREKHLSRKTDMEPNGNFLIMPNRCTMHLVGVCDEERYAATAGYFDDVYGFKMSCLRKPMITEASIEVIPVSKVVTTDAMIHELDISIIELKDTEFDKNFSFVAKSDCNLTAIGGYFDCFFEAPNIKDWQPSMFTTGPFGPATHWKQTLFYLEEKLTIQCDQKICGNIKVTRPKKDVRSLNVVITLNGRRPQFFTVE